MLRAYPVVPQGMFNFFQRVIQKGNFRIMDQCIAQLIYLPFFKMSLW